MLTILETYGSLQYDIVRRLGVNPKLGDDGIYRKSNNVSNVGTSRCGHHS